MQLAAHVRAAAADDAVLVALIEGVGGQGHSAQREIRSVLNTARYGSRLKVRTQTRRTTYYEVVPLTCRANPFSHFDSLLPLPIFQSLTLHRYDLALKIKNKRGARSTSSPFHGTSWSATSSMQRVRHALLRWTPAQLMQARRASRVEPFSSSAHSRGKPARARLSRTKAALPLPRPWPRRLAMLPSARCVRSSSKLSRRLLPSLPDPAILRRTRTRGPARCGAHLNRSITDKIYFSASQRLKLRRTQAACFPLFLEF